MSDAEVWLADTPEGRRHSYDLTQKLTYFVVSLELVFCGYLLLNADKLENFEQAPYLFVASGLAATMGLLWRFCYNMTYHASAHFEQSKKSGYFESCPYRLAVTFQSWFYYVYVGITIPTIFFILGSGFLYIKEYPRHQHSSATIVKSEGVANETSGAVHSIPAKEIAHISKSPPEIQTNAKKPKG